MLSICIITKNEKENLKECLECCKKYPYEVVVVDTGSTDGSKEIAKNYTESFYEFSWCDDFSAARNFAASKAKNDLIFMLDTDEFIDELDAKSLAHLLEKKEGQVGRICRVNAYHSMGNDLSSKERVNRIYDRRLFHYEGSIHEQIVALDGKSYRTWNAPVEMHHGGYLGGKAEREQKANRNLQLLMKELEKNEKDTYILYQIGKSYYYKGDYKRAIEYFERTFVVDINPKLEYVIDMMICYGYALINTGEYGKALQMENLWDDFADFADYSFMMGNIYMQNEMLSQAVEAFLDAARHELWMVEGTNSFLAYYNIGVIYECVGDKENALKYYRQCGSYDKALERIQSI